MNILSLGLAITGSTLLCLGCSVKNDEQEIEPSITQEPVLDQEEPLIEERITSTIPVEAKDIIASKDFEFSIASEVNIIVNNNDNLIGTLHIYHKSEGIDENYNDMPDPLSRVISYPISQNTEFPLTTNINWENLYLHWIPRSPHSNEYFSTLNLSSGNTSYNIDI